MRNKDVIQKTIIIVQFILLVVLLYVPLSVVVDSAGFSKPGHELDPGDTSVFHKTGGYKIDAGTILDAIDRKQSPLFLDETGLSVDPNREAEIYWSQSEYMKVVDALFEFIWKESLSNDWYLHKMTFKANCNKSSEGFEYATFVFYQLIFRQGELRYNARALEILPQNAQVLWGGASTFFRPILGANVIDRDDLKTSADDVIRIAEANGGKAIRESIQDKCNIHLYLNGDWEVDYVGNDGLPILNMHIDSNTGEVIQTR